MLHTTKHQLGLEAANARFGSEQLTMGFSQEKKQQTFLLPLVCELRVVAFVLLLSMPALQEVI